jgi:hypothetical protein
MLFSGRVSDKADPLGRRCAHWLGAFLGVEASAAV